MLTGIFTIGVKLGRKVMIFCERVIRRVGRHTYIDRSEKSENLVIIVAGYQDYLWDNVLPRIKNIVQRDLMYV